MFRFDASYAVFLFRILVYFSYSSSSLPLLTPVPIPLLVPLPVTPFVPVYIRLSLHWLFVFVDVALIQVLLFLFPPVLVRVLVLANPVNTKSKQVKQYHQLTLNILCVTKL